MKKSFLISLVCLFALACMSLIACQPEHEHTFNKNWTYDKEYHWYTATCEHTEEVSSKEKHTFVLSTGRCRTCSYKKGDEIPDSNNPTPEQPTPEEVDDEDKLIYQKTSDGTYMITGVKDSAIEAGVTSLKLPAKHNKIDVTAIGDSAFLSIRTTLTAIEIPEGYTTFYSEAFSSLTYLEEIIFPSTAHTYGDTLFYDCTNLKKVVFSQEAEYFGQSIFVMCENLVEVILPDNLTEIPMLTFSACYSLESVIIPASVTSFGDYSFHSTRALTEIYFMGTQDEWNAITKGNLWNEGMASCTYYFLGDLLEEEQ